jgi:hypothetical protein
MTMFCCTHHSHRRDCGCALLGVDGSGTGLMDGSGTGQAGVDAGAAPAAVARSVAAAAYEKGAQKRGSTPYSAAATDAFDMVYCGGKRDDITVLCIMVDEEAAETNT